MPWIPRGLRDGIVTSRFPRREDDYGPNFRASVNVAANSEVTPAVTEAARVCPTVAITVSKGNIRLDQGRCVLCARCTLLAPEVFAMNSSPLVAQETRPRLVVPNLLDENSDVERVRRNLERRTKALRRSIHIRHVDAGSDGADEWEIAALTNPVYDVQRLGIFFTASPRHADVLLVTGVATAGMRESLRHTFDVMPNPKVVIAAGVDAVSGGMLAGGYAAGHGVSDVVPVDVFVPGSPASPFSVLQGILLAVGLFARQPNSKRNSS